MLVEVMEVVRGQGERRAGMRRRMRDVNAVARRWAEQNPGRAWLVVTVAYIAAVGLGLAALLVPPMTSPMPPFVWRVAGSAEFAAGAVALGYVVVRFAIEGVRQWRAK
jgi:hypothetical protein